MGATLTTVTHITKEVYGPRIVDQLESETVLLKRIEKSSKGVESQVGGKYVTFPLRVGRNHGIGYRNELEALQAAGQQGYQSVRVPLRYGYGRVHISGQTFDLVESNYQAFASAMTREMEGLKDDIAKDTNRVLWGDGTGKVGQLNGAMAATNNGVVDDVQFLEVGMQVDIITHPAGTVKASNRQITAINSGTLTVTFSGAAITAADNDIIVRTGNYDREPEGLTSLVSDSTDTLFNLSKSTEPTWESYVTSMGGALTEAKMIQVCDELRVRSGKKPTVVFADLGSRRAYFNLLKTERRYVNTKDFAGGHNGIAFNYGTEIPVVEDVDAPAGVMWFLHEPAFCIYRDKPWSWEDRDGNIWKWVTGFDAYEGLMKQYWEFALDRRNVHAKLTGITAG
jgi:hypothetical protein